MFQCSSRAPARPKWAGLSGELSREYLAGANKCPGWEIPGKRGLIPSEWKHPDDQLCAVRRYDAGSVIFSVNGPLKAGDQLLQPLPSPSLETGATQRSRSRGLVTRQCSSIFSASKFSLIRCYSHASGFACQGSLSVQND